MHDTVRLETGIRMLVSVTIRFYAKLTKEEKPQLLFKLPIQNPFAFGAT